MQVLGPLSLQTDAINSMIDDVATSGVESAAITIGVSIFLAYFIEMYQITSADVSRGFRATAI